MFFDINSQIKLAQNLTEFTLRNMSASYDAMNKAAPSGAAANKNPVMEMMNPAAWIEQMMANAPSSTAPGGPSLWWPLNPAFLSMLQPPAPAAGNMAIPNLAIPLGLTPFGLSPFGVSPFQPGPFGSNPYGLNPFGTDQSDTTPAMPMFSTRSPFTGDHTPELPNMFWWLVQPDQKEAADEAKKDKDDTAPWAMVMDPFGLLANSEPEPEPEADEEEEDTDTDTEAFNPFHMMFDPFGLLQAPGLDPKTKSKSKAKAKAKKSEASPAPTALDFFDPLGLMKPRSADEKISADEKSRNAFVGFQPGAQHPLMNSGRRTGMFYVAVALPPEIENINPHIPGWNLAF